jgi:hypothetical protein
MAEVTCCPSEAQSTCCEPEAKDPCCSPAAAGGSCGCSEGDIRETVRERYAAAARRAGSTAVITRADERGVFGASLYSGEAAEAPDAAVSASLGCGVPTAVADLHEGETVSISDRVPARTFSSVPRVWMTPRAAIWLHGPGASPEH